MIEVSDEVEILAPPDQVWKALVDFASYPRWNPHVAVREASGSGNEIEWSYGPPFKRRIWTPASITERDEPGVLAWWLGEGWVFRLDERFFLEAVGGGTLLRHEVACRGLAATLGGGLMRRRLTLLVTSANEGLKHYLEARIRALPAPAMSRKMRRASARMGHRHAPSQRR